MPIESINTHMNVLMDNMKEVDRLTGIHSQITTTGPGYKPNVQVLHKSAIVLLVACWEAYVEDLVSATLEEMIKKAGSHSIFPDSVLERVGSKHSGKKAWDLAGDGWKKSLRDNKKEVLARTVGSLNTPKTAQVNELFSKTIGLKDLSSSWYWSGRSVSKTTSALDALVALRGSVAHRVSTSRNVTLKNVRDSRGLVFRLSVKSHNRACEFLTAQVGSSPWLKCQFGKTT